MKNEIILLPSYVFCLIFSRVYMAQGSKKCTYIRRSDKKYVYTHLLNIIFFASVLIFPSPTFTKVPFFVAIFSHNSSQKNTNEESKEEAFLLTVKKSVKSKRKITKYLYIGTSSRRFIKTNLLCQTSCFLYFTSFFLLHPVLFCSL